MPPATDILFLPSIRSSLKTALIKNAELLLYTPAFEHFGIVPVESMLLKTPVLAVNNGGPLESVVNFDFTNTEEATGFTEEPNHEKWAKIMIKYYNDLSPETKAVIGENGYERVLAKFSRDQTSQAFMDNLRACDSAPRLGLLYIVVRFWQIVLLVIIAALAVLYYS